MAVFRVNKNKNYTVMSNYHFKDKSLSLKAKGLLSQMLSLPDGWDYTVAGLCAINKESKPAITSALNELKQAGYLVVTKLMPNQTKSGRIEYIYDIHEKPMTEKQGIEKLGLVYQGVENITQLNTYNKNTNKLNTKESISKDIEQAHGTFGNQQINEMFDIWNEMFGYKPKNSAENRRAVYNMLRSKDKGKEWLLNTMKILKESQKDRYAGRDVKGVAGFAELSYSYDKIWKWGSDKHQEMSKNITNIEI